MANHGGPMACPNDGTTLVMSERSGIEIDYCPTCRGVWLDRGELDKIIERNSAQAPRQDAPPDSQDGSWGQPQDYRRQDHGHRPHKRRRSFLEDLFD